MRRRPDVRSTGLFASFVIVNFLIQPKIGHTCRVTMQLNRLIVHHIQPFDVIVGGKLRRLQSGDAIQRHHDVEDVSDFGAIDQGNDRRSMRPELAPIS
jgi:hypothetical protein